MVAGDATAGMLVFRAGVCFFFFNDTATTEIYTLSLHDALPISLQRLTVHRRRGSKELSSWVARPRSEEHTSELQSRSDLVCRLLLEKKKNEHRHHRAHQIDRPVPHPLVHFHLLRLPQLKHVIPL